VTQKDYFHKKINFDHIQMNRAAMWFLRFWLWR